MKTDNKFTIKRSIWLKGDKYLSRLHRKSDGKMCCLGIFLEHLGVPKEQLTGKPFPWHVLGLEPNSTLPCWLFDQDNNSLVHDIAKANDAQGLLTREDVITKLFAKQGVEVTFED